MFAYISVSYLSDLTSTIYTLKMYMTHIAKTDLILTFEPTFDLWCCLLGTIVLTSAEKAHKHLVLYKLGCLILSKCFWITLLIQPNTVIYDIL